MITFHQNSIPYCDVTDRCLASKMNHYDDGSDSTWTDALVNVVKLVIKLYIDL